MKTTTLFEKVQVVLEDEQQVLGCFVPDEVDYYYSEKLMQSSLLSENPQKMPSVMLLET